MTLKFNRVRAVVKQNIIKLIAAVHQLSCFLPYLAMAKNQKIRSCDLDL